MGRITIGKEGADSQGPLIGQSGGWNDDLDAKGDGRCRGGKTAFKALYGGQGGNSFAGTGNDVENATVMIVFPRVQAFLLPGKELHSNTSSRM